LRMRPARTVLVESGATAAGTCASAWVISSSYP
jgi:hypothetical protein